MNDRNPPGGTHEVRGPAARTVPGHARPAGEGVVIRVILAEDQAMVRGALASLLGLEPDIDVVGEAASGEEAVAVAVRTRPDIALLDIEMPGMDGLEVVRHLAAFEPRPRFVEFEMYYSA